VLCRQIIQAVIFYPTTKGFHLKVTLRRKGRAVACNYHSPLQISVKHNIVLEVALWLPRVVTSVIALPFDAKLSLHAFSQFNNSAEPEEGKGRG
jgi:hypothetical protein